MDIYERKSRWKWYLAIVGLLVLVVSMVFTNYLADQLTKSEVTKVELWVNAYKAYTDDINKLNEEMERASPEELEEILNKDITAEFETTQIIDDIPLILVNDQGNIEDAVNYPEVLDDNEIIISEKLEVLHPEIKKLERENRVIEVENLGFKQYIYYGHSQTLQLLKYFPYLQFLLIAGFIAFGYFSFSSSRKAEQNQVWVGMAKETAHQLGTPISAVMGWIDHLKEMYGQDEYLVDVVGELKKDTNRLELIADRFSKIGSEPKMKEVDIYGELESMRDYMQRRASRKITFDFPDPQSETKMVSINPPLFNWVLENLLRNALDAMGGKGKISANVYNEKNHICIDISDTGKGIPASKFKTVFKPGYSTKKRGWGLGLSLAKRIIETYHSGRIFVSKSVPNEQTTFTIKLPVNHHVRGETEIQSPA